MNRSRLVVQSLFHYWRTNLAVLLGVIAGTAVIGGALIVGDSVKASLRQMTLDRLGKIDFALSGPRFVREELSDSLIESVNEHNRDILSVTIEEKDEERLGRLRIGQFAPAIV